MKYCEFCKLLVKQLKEGTGHFKGFPKEVREQYLDSMNKESPYRKEGIKILGCESTRKMLSRGR